MLGPETLTAGSSIGAALLPSISKAPLAGQYGSSGLSARPKAHFVSERSWMTLLSRLFKSKLTSKGGKGVAAPLSTRGMSRHWMGEMLFFDYIIPTVVLMGIKVDFRSALLLATHQRERCDHDYGNEGDAADGYSNNGPW